MLSRANLLLFVLWTIRQQRFPVSSLIDNVKIYSAATVTQYNMLGN
jgi:formylmethanofuran dehydrogenase subunit E-like metal-binding protein